MSTKVNIDKAVLSSVPSNLDSVIDEVLESARKQLQKAQEILNSNKKAKANVNSIKKIDNLISDASKVSDSVVETRAYTSKMVSLIEAFESKSEAIDESLEKFISALLGVSAVSNAETVSANTGAITANSVKSSPWYEKMWNGVKDFVSGAKELLEKVAATIATVFSSALRGIAGLVENVLDCVAYIGGALVTAGAWIGDKLTGNDTYKDVWNGVKGFVATEHVNGWWDSFYEKTAVGKWMSQESFIDPQGAVAAGISTAYGFIGTVALTVVCPPAGLAVAGTSAFGDVAQIGVQNNESFLKIMLKGGVSAALNVAMVKGVAGAVSRSLTKVGAKTTTTALTTTEGTTALTTTASSTSSSSQAALRASIERSGAKVEGIITKGGKQYFKIVKKNGMKDLVTMDGRSVNYVDDIYETVTAAKATGKAAAKTAAKTTTKASNLYSNVAKGSADDVLAITDKGLKGKVGAAAFKAKSAATNATNAAKNVAKNVGSKVSSGAQAVANSKIGQAASNAGSKVASGAKAVANSKVGQAVGSAGTKLASGAKVIAKSPTAKKVIAGGAVVAGGLAVADKLNDNKSNADIEIKPGTSIVDPTDPEDFSITDPVDNNVPDDNSGKNNNDDKSNKDKKVNNSISNTGSSGYSGLGSGSGGSSNKSSSSNKKSTTKVAGLTSTTNKNIETSELVDNIGYDDADNNIDNVTDVDTNIITPPTDEVIDPDTDTQVNTDTSVDPPVQNNVSNDAVAVPVEPTQSQNSTTTNTTYRPSSSTTDVSSNSVVTPITGSTNSSIESVENSEVSTSDIEIADSDEDVTATIPIETPKKVTKTLDVEETNESNKSSGNIAIPIGLGVVGAGAAAVAGARYIKNKKSESEEYDENYDDENNQLNYGSENSDSAYMNDNYLGPSGSSYTDTTGLEDVTSEDFVPDDNSYTDASDLENDDDDLDNDIVFNELNIN